MPTFCVDGSAEITAVGRRAVDSATVAGAPPVSMMRHTSHCPAVLEMLQRSLASVALPSGIFVFVSTDAPCVYFCLKTFRRHPTLTKPAHFSDVVQTPEGYPTCLVRLGTLWGFEASAALVATLLPDSSLMVKAPCFLRPGRTLFLTTIVALFPPLCSRPSGLDEAVERD